MTDDELDRLDALARAATPGPWVQEPDLPSSTEPSRWITNRWPVDGDGIQLVIEVEEQDNAVADAAFIAASRTAIPALLAEVRKLRALVGEGHHATVD